MFKPASPQTIKHLFTLYQNNSNPHYFRHFPPNLPFNTFKALFQIALPFEIHNQGDIAGVLTVSLNQLTRNVDLGIILYTDHQHQGLAFKAMKKQADILFKHQAHKICSNVSSSDTRSRTLLEKGGFIKEATLRDFSFYNGHYHDDIRYALPFKRYKRLYK